MLNSNLDQQIFHHLADALRETNLPGLVVERGKVRDNYPLGNQHRLIVTTDRLSAFDRVLAYVPYKGQVLTQVAAWWFHQTKDILPNHLLSVPDPNVMLVRDARPLPVEMVIRGYLTGVTGTSLWTMYHRGERSMYGQQFPEGMVKNQQLPMPVLTPTTKAAHGQHDAPITPDDVVTMGLVDPKIWRQMIDATFAIFKRGQEVAARNGLILVDTKYEFGLDSDGKLILIDEVHTPDSSRYWRMSSYGDRLASGQEPEILDKEYIRLWYVNQGYRGDGDPPALPDEVVMEASRRYIQVYEALTEQAFDPVEYPAEPRMIEALKKAGLLG